jgi:DNA-binding response OmpR family regulator
MSTSKLQILCVEGDRRLLETRCALLKFGGCATSAESAQLAESLLHNRHFDLVVLSSDLTDLERRRVSAEAREIPVLQLHGFTSPQELVDRTRVLLRHLLG